MSTADEPGTVEVERRRLTDLAYRFLGSLAEAEDAVQEAYTRWYALGPQQQGAIVSPAAWLTTVVSRVCLNVLGSARARRERYVGEWIPEPLPGGGGWVGTRPSADPADRITLDESVTMAFLVVLDAMTPAERVAFVLHDVFGYPFADIGEIVGRTPAACRQLASSARRRVRPAPTPATPTAEQTTIVRRFKRAWEARDIGALIGVLDPDATATADGGGLVEAALYPVRGGGTIARTLLDLAARAPDFTLVERTVNARPGLVAEQDGTVSTVYAFDTACGRITRIWAVRNPEKLRAWTTGR